jgi:hypothetical protein
MLRRVDLQAPFVNYSPCLPALNQLDFCALELAPYVSTETALVRPRRIAGRACQSLRNEVWKSDIVPV